MFAKIKGLLRQVLGKVRLSIDRITHSGKFHFGHVVTHVGYFAFVFIEGHGIYAIFGGVLAIVTLLDLFGGGEA